MSIAAPKHINWLQYLYPGQAELQNEQSYWDTKRKRHLAGEHSAGVASGMEVVATGPASLLVDVETGRVVDTSGDDVVILTSAYSINLTAFVPGAGTQLVYIVALFGTLDTTPYIVPETGLSQMRYTEDAAVVRAQTAAPSGTQVELARVLIAAAAAQITDPTNPDLPGNNEIDMRKRVYSNVRGLSLQVTSGAADTPLSAVTVGEKGCDFRDIASAISYVNALTTSETRQVAILVFGKENGKSWQPGAALTIPTFTHLVGVGKPSLIFSGLAGNLITLSPGASIENFHVQVDNSWTVVVLFNGHDSEARNVTVRYEHNSTVNNYAFSATGFDRLRIVDCELFPYSLDVTKGCQGIYLSNCDKCFVVGCYLDGTDYLLYMDTCADCIVSELGIFERLAAGNQAVYITSGSSVSVSNVVCEFVAGVVNVFYVRGVSLSRRVTLTNIVVRCATDDVAVGLDLSNATITGFELTNCYMLVFTQCIVSSGNIYFPNAVAHSAVGVQSARNRFNLVYIDRGGVAEPGIEALFNTADGCMVANCQILNTLNTACVMGLVAAGADRWVVLGNTYDVAAAAPDDGGGANWEIHHNFPLA